MLQGDRKACYKETRKKRQPTNAGQPHSTRRKEATFCYTSIQRLIQMTISAHVHVHSRFKDVSALLLMLLQQVFATHIVAAACEGRL